MAEHTSTLYLLFLHHPAFPNIEEEETPISSTAWLLADLTIKLLQTKQNLSHLAIFAKEEIIIKETVTLSTFLPLVHAPSVATQLQWGRFLL